MQNETSSPTILVTGGLGYIGSHTVVELIVALNENKLHLQNNDTTKCKVLIIDDLSNASSAVLGRIKKLLEKSHNITNTDDYLEFVKLDILNLSSLESLFDKKAKDGNPIEYIIHFAAKKLVGESVKIPLLYFELNFGGTLNILKCMEKYNCNNFIFSSSCSVYGKNDDCKEDDQVTFNSPYACTKLCVEHMLKAVAMVKKNLRVISLRYFNPCGAHESGMIGDAPTTYPNNLFPFIEELAIGKREYLSIFGSDYQTKDGTGVRDYVHVVDVANAHVIAINKLSKISSYEVYNLGTGNGYSVLEIIKTYSKVIGKELPYKLVDRRPGDVDVAQCQPSKALAELNWKAVKNLEDMCRDSYRWITSNPEGIKE
ncbi:MAG: UDP-glucose 4-epimerase GalE [Rickettsiales bacterium]|nr:MAG: UDP-glucose 4-epimerase GalE [Rickettsiales bacterium]